MARETKRFTISSMPSRNGLLSAGQQATIDEKGWWQAINATADLDGMISKRPGLKQWGQTLYEPDSGATDSTITAYVDFLDSTLPFNTTDDSGTPAKIAATVRQGLLETNVRGGDGGEDYLLSYSVPTVSANDAWSMRLLFQGTNLPVYSDTTDTNTFAFRAQGADDSGKEFAIWSGGLYYKQTSDSKYVLIADTEAAGAGNWVTIEVRCDDDGGNTTVYLEDTLVATLTSADLDDVSMTGTTAFELYWLVEGTTPTPPATAEPGTQYSTRISTVMYNDVAADAFATNEVSAVTGFQYSTTSGTLKRAALCACGEYIYHDNGLLTVWRPLARKQYSVVHFTPYQQTIMWVNHNGAKLSQLWQWNGSDDPETFPDAPNLHFATEHLQRLWGAGPENPLRLYYSADREPDVWYSPTPDNTEDEFSVALDAGYIDIPVKGGDRVSAAYGDYYGTLIAYTRNTTWRIDGFGLNSFQRRNISQKVGCENADCVTQVGNDLWALHTRGISSLVATDQFGDLQVQHPSGPIQDLWSRDPSRVVTIARDFLKHAKVGWEPQQNLVYVAVPITGDTRADHVYVISPAQNNWLGPWVMENRAMANVEIASPVLEVMMHGDSEGRIGYTDATYKADFDDAEYTLTLESAALNGRSVHPSLISQRKTWKALRLFYLPRGDWSFTVTWWTDTRKAGGPRSKNQNDLFKTFVIGDEDGDGTGDFRLDLDPDGVLRSSQEMAVIEIDLDMPGYNLIFEIEQDGAGQDLALQGWEVEATAAGVEENYGN